MKQNKPPRRPTQAYNILSLIAISGELPVNQIIRLPGGYKHKTDLIKDLKRKKYIKTYYNDKLRGYRLTANGKDMLCAENRKRFESLFIGETETNYPKYEIKRRLRLKSIAETIVTMQNAGIVIYRDEKSDIFYPKDESKKMLSVTPPVFYSSREMKMYGEGFTQIRGARAVGTLLIKSKIFVVYNTSGSLMKWDFRSEIKTKTLVETVLGIERLPHQYSDRDIRGLMLGDSMEQAYQLITNINKKSTKTKYFMLDDTYENFLYLPNDHNGEMTLRLLCDTEKTEKLNYILSQGLNKHNPGMFAENDAVDENGDPVLFAYDFDMQRIIRFNAALKTHNKKGTLICFDFQADVLKRYCCENIIFQFIDTDKFERRFFP
jgi:hypothetical protein